MSNALHPILKMLTDPKVPMIHKRMALVEIVQDTSPPAEAVLQRLCQTLTEKTADAALEEKQKEVEELLQEMREGPKRHAVFLALLSEGLPVPQAFVVLDDGTHAYCNVPKLEVVRGLVRGDAVLVDGKGRAVLSRAHAPLKTGEEGTLEQRLDEAHIEITGRAGERTVVTTTAALMQRIEAGEVAPGRALIVNPRQALAVDALPPRDKPSHSRFLDRGPTPTVTLEDIGDPHPCIQRLLDHVRLEMLHPQRRRRFRLRSCLSLLLSGVSGGGKTLTINCLHRLIYELMSEVTGIPIAELPPRVFRLRNSQALSMWLGESDKNLDRFFDELVVIAGETVLGRDGRTYRLPTLCILEEVDGIGRMRGEESIMDRILTTALTRLDPHRSDLSDKIILFLATTNEPHLVDPAFLRRVGGSIAYFGRLQRAGFQAVLRKHLRGLPVAADNGCSVELLERRLVQDLTAWLFHRNNSERSLVELVYAGSTTPVPKYRRDFLTGALVERAVQDAAHEASQSSDPDDACGLTLEQLMRALDLQIRGVVNQLRETNIGSYTDLPDGVRVATVRRTPQPAHLPFEFHRH